MPQISYPSWLVTVFPIPIVTLLAGFLAAAYAIIVGFTSVALALSYFIPLSLTALYLLLGVAERSSRDQHGV
jgi:hypothetical protein